MKEIKSVKAFSLGSCGWVAEVINQDGYNITVAGDERLLHARAIELGYLFREGCGADECSVFKLAVAIEIMTSGDKVAQKNTRSEVSEWRSTGVRVWRAAQEAIIKENDMKCIQKPCFVLAAALISNAASAQALGGFGGFGQPDREMSANRYGQGNALRAGQAFEAEVVSVRAVTIKPNASLSNQGAGAAVGGSLGALAASQIKGGGSDRWVVTTALSALGGLAGAAVGSPSEIPAQEVVIKNKASGAMIVVTQAGSDLKAGDSVIVTEVNGEIRVSKRSER